MHDKWRDIVVDCFCKNTWGAAVNWRAIGWFGCAVFAHQPRNACAPGLARIFV